MFATGASFFVPSGERCAVVAACETCSFGCGVQCRLPCGSSMTPIDGTTGYNDRTAMGRATAFPTNVVAPEPPGAWTVAG